MRLIVQTLCCKTWVADFLRRARAALMRVGLGRRTRVCARPLGPRVPPPSDQIQLATLQVLEKLLATKGPSEDRTLEELLGNARFNDDELGKDTFNVTGVRGTSSMTSLSRSIADHPAKWSRQFDESMAAALGGTIDDSLWSAREYGERRVPWGNQEHFHRMWAMMSELHRLDRRGAPALLGAKLRQFMKATELAGRSGGDWQVAWV